MQNKYVLLVPEYLENSTSTSALYAMLCSWTLFKQDFLTFYQQLLNEVGDVNFDINEENVTKAYFRFVEVLDRIDSTPITNIETIRHILIRLANSLLSTNFFSHKCVNDGFVLNKESIVSLYIANLYVIFEKNISGGFAVINQNWINNNWSSFLENVKEHPSNFELMFFNIFEARDDKGSVA